MNRKAILLGMALALLVVGAARAMSGGNFNLPWSTNAAGGDERTSSQYRLRDTIGQGAIGIGQGDGVRLRAGYWSGVPLTPVVAAYRIFWQAIADGGRAYGAGYRAGDAVGQVAIGESSGSEFRVAAGYWPGAGGLGEPITTTPSPTPTPTATPTPTPLPGGGYVAGQVDLQGRSNDSGAMVVAVAVAQTYSVTTNASGGFRIEAVSGTYTVTASMDGYLYARRSGVSVSTGATTTLSAVRLLGGDAVANNAVDIYDLTLLGASFGSAGGAADINGDGVVNVYDLVMVGANFGRSAPVAW